MTYILGKFRKVIEDAIVEGREISVCLRHNNNSLMSSFRPTEVEVGSYIYIVGDNYSLNISIDGIYMEYDEVDDEFHLLSNNVDYYIGVI